MDLAHLKGLLAQDQRRAQLRARYHLRHANVGSNPLLVGRPLVECRQLSIGDDLIMWSKLAPAGLLGHGRIQVGDRVFINSGAVVDAAEQVVVEDDVALGIGCYVTDTDHHGLAGARPRVLPTRVMTGAWVGTRALVLPGVTIGSRAVVAAGAVVTRDVPDDGLVAGVPARLIRTIAYPPGVLRAWTD